MVGLTVDAGCVRCCNIPAHCQCNDPALIAQLDSSANEQYRASAPLLPALSKFCLHSALTALFHCWGFKHGNNQSGQLAATDVLLSTNVHQQHAAEHTQYSNI
jgi:hypothetical protein